MINYEVNADRNWSKGSYSKFYFVIWVMKPKLTWYSFVEKIVSPSFVE